MTASLHTSMPATVETWHSGRSEWHTPSIVWDRTGEKIHLEEVRNIAGKQQLRKFAEDMRIRAASLNEELACALQAHDGLGPYQQLAAQELRVKIKRIRQLRDKFRRFLNEANIEIGDRRDRERKEYQDHLDKLAQAKLAIAGAKQTERELSDHDRLAKFHAYKQRTAFYSLLASRLGETEVERLKIQSDAMVINDLAPWAAETGIDAAVAENYVEKAQKELGRKRSQLEQSDSQTES